MSLNQQLDFHAGYLAALDEVFHKLTGNEYGRTEAYEATVKWLKEQRSNG